MKKSIVAGALALSGVSISALAHPQAGAVMAAVQGGIAAPLLAGLAHPFTGFDHLLAMLAAGIWSVRQQHGRALPLLFLGMLLLGALSGVAGAAIAGLESGIAATVALTGGLIAVAVRLPPAAGALMLAIFAALHGNAHGHALPQAASAAGFLAASGVLLALGRWFGRVAQAELVRAAGACIAAAGVLLLTLR